MDPLEGYAVLTKTPVLVRRDATGTGAVTRMVLNVFPEDLVESGLCVSPIGAAQFGLSKNA